MEAVPRARAGPDSIPTHILIAFVGCVCVFEPSLPETHPHVVFQACHKGVGVIAPSW